MKTDKEYFNLKIDKEYYEKLKTIDYSKVKEEINKSFDEYLTTFLPNAGPIGYEEEEPLYFDNYGEPVYDPSNRDLVFTVETDEYMKNVVNKIQNYFYENRMLITIIVAYNLMISQEYPLNKKLSLFSMLGDSTFSNKTKEIIDPYIRDSDYSYFPLFMFPLINKFTKDEILSFILFNFNYNSYFISDGLLKLFLNILNIKDNEEVLNLYSGLGNFLIKSSLYNSNTIIYGYDDFDDLLNISVIRTSLFSNNIKFENRYKNNGEKITTLEYLENRVNNNLKVDKIFLNLSLISEYYNENREKVTIDYRNKIKNNLKIDNIIVKEASLEWLLYILLINQLKDNGKAISLVATNILSNHQNKNIRKYFIENGHIESIILLPYNLMIGYSTSLVLIVFSKGNKKIRFINATEFYENEKLENNKQKIIALIPNNDINNILYLLNDNKKTNISFSKKIEDFSKNDYNLDVIENIEVLEEFENGVVFKNVVKNIMRGSQTKLDKEKTKTKTTNVYLSLSDINDGLVEFENIKEYLKEIPEKQEKFCIKNNSILLSKYGNPPYKFAIAQIPNDIEKVLASSNFIIIEVDEEKLNPWYLAAFFSSNSGSIVLRTTYTGSDNLTLSIKKLEDSIIPVPPMEEQEKIGKEYQKTINEIKEMKKKLNDKIQSTKDIYKKYSGDLVLPKLI